MPSTENTTLDRIQREIMDVMEREKELKNLYSNINNNIEHSIINGNDRPPLMRAQSTSVLLDGESSNNNNNIRRFVANPGTKGVMQRFLKTRGKLNTVTTLANSIKRSNPILTHDFSPPKLEPGKRIRNGYVPVEERIRKEVQEAHHREKELRSLRRKSQPNLDQFTDFELCDEEPPTFGKLRAAKSMAQLYDGNDMCDENSSSSAPSSLKQARSLADLCNASEDEIQSPQSLIMQFEKMISQNKETAARI